MKRSFFWSILLVFLGGLALQTRPARLRSARVTAVTPGTPPIASVALTYGSGTAPVSVIVDVRGRDGNGGSATIDGQQRFVELPLVRAPQSGYAVVATAFYRVFGMLWVSTREFTEDVNIS